MQASRRILLTRASDIQMKPVRWTWADRIPFGAISVIPGREGIGKSLLLAWLTAQLTKGTLPGVHYGTPRPVIYAASEDSWAHTIAPRLYAAGADLGLVYRVDVETNGVHGQLSLPYDCAALATEIERLGVALLAADPLLSLISAGIDTHKDRELRNALEPLARLADRTGCAVVGLAHFNKSANVDALTLITGSRAFSAVARAVLAVAEDPSAGDGSCVMSQAKNNLGKRGLSSLRYVVNTAEVPTAEGPAYVGKLEFTGETDRSVDDILAETGRDPVERTEQDEAAEWIREFLTERGEVPFADVLKAARAAGIAERTLKRARARAGAVSQRRGYPAISTWRLHEDLPTSLPGQSGQHSQDAGPTGLTGPAGPGKVSGATYTGAPEVGPTGPTGLTERRRP